MDSEPWLQMLGRSCVSFPSGDNFVVFVDPVSLEVAGSSATLRPSAEVAKLIDSAVRNHRQQIAKAVQSREGYGWEEQLESDTSLVGSGGLVWEPGQSVAALMVGFEPIDRANSVDFDPVPVSASTALQAVLDERMRCVFQDPRLRSVGLDPDVYLGSHAWSTVHPADLARVCLLVEQVVSGDAVEVDYVMRLAGPMGDWYNHHIVLRPLVGERPGYLLTMRALGARRRRIEAGQLSGRELQVAADFYSGLSIAAIARRYAVSERTVRNQMSSVYGKLGVGSSDELIRAYDPPDRLLREQIGVRSLI